MDSDIGYTYNTENNDGSGKKIGLIILIIIIIGIILYLLYKLFFGNSTSQTTPTTTSPTTTSPTTTSPTTTAPVSTPVTSSPSPINFPPRSSSNPITGFSPNNAPASAPINSPSSAPITTTSPPADTSQPVSSTAPVSSLPSNIDPNLDHNCITSGYGAIYGTDIYGFDLASNGYFGNVTKEQCQDKCDSNSSCQFATYGENNGDCWLKMGVTDANFETGFKIRNNTCSGNSCPKYSVLNKTNITGDNMTLTNQTITSSDVGGCRKICDDYNCDWYTYNTDGTCAIKRAPSYAGRATLFKVQS